jgi:hypothetical protein
VTVEEILRKAAAEIRAANINGWGNACEAGADRIRALEAALERSRLAIDDWLHLFAPELCNADDVARSRSRVMAVGTLAYIADVQQQNRIALGSELETACEHDWHSNPNGDRYCPKCEASALNRAGVTK